MADRIHRVTMFKIPAKEDQEKLVAQYKVLAANQERVCLLLGVVGSEARLTRWCPKGRQTLHPLHRRRPGRGGPKGAGLHSRGQDRVRQPRRHDVLRRLVRRPPHIEGLCCYAGPYGAAVDRVLLAEGLVGSVRYQRFVREQDYG